jgi:hypothetical protein
VYVAFSIPVAYGVITLLGYRREDRLSYRFDRSSLKYLYHADLWAPIQDWWVLSSLGCAFLLATMVTMVPVLIVMAHAEELQKTGWAKDNWFLLKMLETSPEDLIMPMLRRLALPFALVWAAHAFLPSLITYLLVLPAILLLPWSFMTALGHYRASKRWKIR